MAVNLKQLQAMTLKAAIDAYKLRDLALAGYEVTALDVHEADLEDMFRQLYVGGGHAADPA